MRKEYETILGAVTFLALLCAGYAYYALEAHVATTRALPVIVMGYVAVLVLVFKALGLSLTRAKRQELTRHVEAHAPALSRNLRLAVKKNDYNRVVADERQETVLEFLDSVDLSFDYRRIEPAVVDYVLAEVERVEGEAREGGFDANDYPSDPTEFEHWCAAQLRHFGWDADVTKRGYDQGIDIVARKGALVIGLQVKRYNSPVGNKAIQEAFTGKNYYGLAGAGVLATAGFTPSARRLAATTGVLLLSPHDLPNIDREFGVESFTEAWAM
ncbi:restriction endonuclease [Salipiger mangrovisoli]|uniref:Restriction endonuclease n=1 Tax=Salipiger mangrovisoli TaxID=2865933 RepID=A0ABR9X418_9RHOB|nr:restriction endonuclease [Salipiger mangrovisoli]MBE9638288.1 restriction endonuclease [Salipiger mangrovisoli]